MCSMFAHFYVSGPDQCFIALRHADHVGHFHAAHDGYQAEKLLSNH